MTKIKGKEEKALAINNAKNSWKKEAEKDRFSKWRQWRWQASLKPAFVAKQKTREKNKILGYLNYRCHAPKHTHTHTYTSKCRHCVSTETKVKTFHFIFPISTIFPFAPSSGRVPLTVPTKAKEMIIFRLADTETPTKHPILNMWLFGCRNKLPRNEIETLSINSLHWDVLNPCHISLSSHSGFN